ncbi:MAG: uncharacterized membrane protein (UPF0127 family) [Pseudohongiellaceae bacterium]|jgi:uncharacterized membrane protein (UPF0127 family)
MVTERTALPCCSWVAVLRASLWALVVSLPSCAKEPVLTSMPDRHRTELVVAGRAVIVELATDVPTRTRGMMHRTSLGADKGMLFIFEDSAPRVFWMRNTLIPLDIIFLDDDGMVINVEQAPPAVERPGFHSKRPARFVLELNRGWSEEHKLLPGQVIEISKALRDRAES